MAYGLLYVVLEMVGYRLEQAGWADVSGLDVATALTDALLVVAVGAAALLAVHLGVQRWGRSMAGWLAERAGVEAEIWTEPVEATSRRREPLAVTAERVAGPTSSSYTGNPYSFAGHRIAAGHRFAAEHRSAEDPGGFL